MEDLPRLLRKSENNGLSFWCPGCNDLHQINYGEGSGPRWQWNGDVYKPTFTPSVLVTTGHYCKRPGMSACWCTYNEDHPDKQIIFKCVSCHSFITDGNIQFLDDCSHALAGQTVPLPAF
jgi:hypothetical protein